MNRGALCTLIAAAALAGAACSSADAGVARPAPSPAPTGQVADAPSPAAGDHELTVDWTGSFAIALPNGMAVRDCEGEQMDACVYLGEAMLGDVTLLNGYPLSADERDQDAEVVLAGLAAGFLDALREDRAIGCPAFDFVADEVTDAVVGGQPGKRAAFSLVDDDGRVVERVVNHFAVQGSTFVVANADAYVSEGGCLGPSDHDASFSPADLASIEPYLPDLVADSPLPAPPAA